MSPPAPGHAAADRHGLVLAVDLGKTGCRAALFDKAGQRVADATGPGAGGIADRDGLTTARSALQTVLDALGCPPRTPVAVGVGLAGLAQARDRAERLAGELRDELGATRVVLASDMTTSHVGALAGSPGVVVAAGTGAVALAVDHDGRSAVADGWGSWLGDDGSGFAIGRRGLQAVLRAHDGRGAATPLTERARQRYGDPAGLPRLVHGSDNPAREVAAFANDVLDLAAEGDAWCRQVWAQAAEALAATTAAAARRVLPAAQPALVATTGGLFGAGELLTRPYDEALERLLPGHDRRPAVGDSCDGARLLATRSDLPHAALLVVSSDATPAPPRSPQ